MTAVTPRALRVLLLPDRLVLHDITFALRSRDPSDRNALIDATNFVHTRALSVATAASAEQSPPNLIDFDLPTPPRPSSSRPSSTTSADASSEKYLVIPFADDPRHQTFPVPYEASSPEQAGFNAAQMSAVPVEAAAGFLGMLRLHSAVFAVLVSQVRRAGDLPSGPVLAVTRVKLIKLHATMQSKEDRDFSAAVSKLLEGGNLYYSLARDLTQSLEQSDSRKPRPGNSFWWSWPMTRPLPQNCHHWLLRTIYGFVGTNIMRFQTDALPSGTGEFYLTLISRRSRFRAGTRYITRGVDALGNVANFVETEQVVWRSENKHAYSSFLTIRGSVPVFWRQNNGIARPVPELDGSLTSSRTAFSSHFRNIVKSYGSVTAVSLVDKHGSESVLANAFERHFDLDLRQSESKYSTKLVAFDFHKHCAGKEYERGLTLLLSRLQEDIDHYGIFAASGDRHSTDIQQKGVFRVNCVDCLDRTNVVQSMIARVVLNMQLKAVFFEELKNPSSALLRLYGESEDRFKHVWGDNADAVSKQYSGTGALKTDFTRTGKRSTTGVIGDGMKSVMRMYYKNFIDEGRQEVIDILCGNAIIRPPLSFSSGRQQPGITASTSNGDTGKGRRNGNAASGETSLWYSFESLRINAGGDKQAVSIELRDDAMLVTTPEGVRLEYPRDLLASWGRIEEGKVSDRKSPARLRLTYFPSQSAPATTSPLDLLFKGGSPARENFLRALISWSQLRETSVLTKQNIRVRTLAALNVGEHYMADWELQKLGPRAKNELVALIVPEGNAITRSWGLAAVPIDIDESDYKLISACAYSDRGPAIAILASKDLAPQIMNVSESVSKGSSSFSYGGAVAVALQAYGTPLCFVGCQLDGAVDVYRALSALKPGRSGYDITTQFHYLAVAGLMGNMSWPCIRSDIPRSPRLLQWAQLADDSVCYSLANGLSIMKTTFPNWRCDEKLTAESWRSDSLSAQQRESKVFIELSDCSIDGRLAPRLPDNLAQCIVTISELHGEEIRTPPNVDRNTQLSSLIVLDSEYSSSDGIASRQVPRTSEIVEWRDPLRLVMIPSDPKEIFESYIIGQVIIPTALADAVAAGHFVIPIALGQKKTSAFNVPCRMGGVSTGRIYGKIGVEVDYSGTMQQSEAVSSRGSRDVASGSYSRNVSRSDRQMRSDHIEASFAGSNSAGERSSSLTGFGASPYLPTPSRDEVAEKLEAARKKGSKQIKSVVNRLSSLLNQPSPSSGFPTPNVTGRQYRSTAEGYSASGYGRSMESSGLDSISGEGMVERQNSPHHVALEVSDDADVGPFQSGGGVPSEVPSGRDVLLNGLSFEKKRAASGAPSRSIPKYAQESGTDLLLVGLQGEKRSHRQPVASGAHGDDDSWGDFEVAPK